MQIILWLPSLGYGLMRHAGKVAALLLLSIPAYGEEVTIAALGDSLTQGYGLVPDQGFVPQLETWLKDRGQDVRILNAGVSGDTTAGGLSRIGWTLSDDVDALIVALGGNDVLRGLSPEQARANLDGILQAAGDIPVLLVGITAPGNFGPDYKREFEAIYPDLAMGYGTLLYPSFLAALTDREDRQATLENLLQPDGVHPNADGVAAIVAAMGPSVIALIEKVAPAR